MPRPFCDSPVLLPRHGVVNAAVDLAEVPRVDAQPRPPHEPRGAEARAAAGGAEAMPRADDTESESNIPAVTSAKDSSVLFVNWDATFSGKRFAWRPALVRMPRNRAQIPVRSSGAKTARQLRV
mmetsp:Transcript_3663/g.8936  ORF Transcript_3663/g.8936 Transcript_3663/m.8936 type:complete len:124 (+) Transcript_3663:670-1041(+)